LNANDRRVLGKFMLLVLRMLSSLLNRVYGGMWQNVFIGDQHNAEAEISGWMVGVGVSEPVTLSDIQRAIDENFTR
jgi:hypothetical protein